MGTGQIKQRPALVLASPLGYAAWYLHTMHQMAWSLRSGR